MTTDVQQTSHNILQLNRLTYTQYIGSHGSGSFATLYSQSQCVSKLLTFITTVLTCSVKSALHHAVASHGFAFWPCMGSCCRVGVVLVLVKYVNISIISYTACVAFICFVYVCMTLDGLGSCIGEIAQEYSYRGEGTVSICASEYGFCLAEQGSCNMNDNWDLSGQSPNYCSQSCD